MALDPTKYPSYSAECGDPSRTKTLGIGKRLAILLLDVCDAFFSPSSSLHLPDETVQSVTKALSELLNAAREIGPTSPVIPPKTPIIYAQTLYTHADCRDAGLLVQKSPAFIKLFDSKNGNMTRVPKGPQYAALQPGPDDILLKKKYPSPFFGTNLSTQLASIGIDTLVIAGFTTSVSVRAAALDAMQSGFRPIVVAEACGDRGRETHWANLMDMAAKYGDVVSVDYMVDILRQK